MEVVSALVPLRRVGNRFNARCPFADHPNDHSPSFWVTPSMRIFKCFGCGKGGDAIRFLMQMQGKTFTKVVEELADRAGLSLPQNEKLGLYSSIYRILEYARDHFASNLHKSPKIMDYLQKRGLPVAKIRQWKLGYAKDSWDDLYLGLLQTYPAMEVEALLQSGMFRAREDRIYDVFHHRVMFPILDPKGRVISFGGRVLPDSETLPKYLNGGDSPVFHKGRNLYNLHQAVEAKSDQVLLVEGYMDVLALLAQDYNAVVAPLGTGFTEDQIRLLEKSFQKLTLVFDGDAAGVKATQRAMERLLSSRLSVSVVQLPDGLDPQDFMQARGLKAFMEFVERAQSGLRFYLVHVLSGLDLSSERGKGEAFSRVREILRKVNPMLLGTGMQEADWLIFLSSALGLDESILRQQLIESLRRDVVPDFLPNPKQMYPPFVDHCMKLMLWSLSSKDSLRLWDEAIQEIELHPLALEMNTLIHRFKDLPQILAECSEALSDYLTHPSLEQPSTSIDPELFRLSLKKLKLEHIEMELLALSRSDLDPEARRVRRKALLGARAKLI